MISPLGTIPIPAVIEKPSPANVPPPSGVKTSYWAPSESVRIVGITPGGFTASVPPGPPGSPLRRTVIVNVAVQLRAQLDPAVAVTV